MNHTTDLPVFIFVETNGGTSKVFTGATVTPLAATASYANSSGDYTTSVSSAITGLTNSTTVNPATTSANTFTGVTASQMTTWKLPNSSQKFYWRCYAADSATGITATIATDTLAAKFGSANITVTIGSSSTFSFFFVGLSRLLYVLE